MGLHVKRTLIALKKAYVKWIKPEIRYRLSGDYKSLDYKNIPIVINNFNRLEMLKRLIAGFISRGYHNIYIIDNASTYPPLLEWYMSCPYTVYRLNRNIGHLSIWETGLYKQFTHSYFAYTDSDLEICPECPDDFMEKFVAILRRHPSALKAGFSIRIDDIPDCFSHKKEVQEWESQFWLKLDDPDAFKAPIDTTFAVYKPFFKGEIIDFNHTYFRAAPPYSVRHLPWYLDSANLSEEEQYYLEHIKTSTHWSEKEKDESK